MHLFSPHNWPNLYHGHPSRSGEEWNGGGGKTWINAQVVLSFSLVSFWQNTLAQLEAFKTAWLRRGGDLRAAIGLSCWTASPDFPLAQMVKNLPVMQETQVQPLGWEDPLEKGMAVHSSILAWRIPWTEGPGGLQCAGLKELGTTERPTPLLQRASPTRLLSPPPATVNVPVAHPGLAHVGSLSGPLHIPFWPRGFLPSLAWLQLPAAPTEPSALLLDPPATGLPWGYVLPVSRQKTDISWFTFHFLFNLFGVSVIWWSTSFSGFLNQGCSSKCLYLPFYPFLSSNPPTSWQRDGTVHSQVWMHHPFYIISCVLSIVTL